MNSGSADQRTTPVIFKGKATEYFGIWIVNLLLTLLTLGIYSAWAKVRRKKYFYHNTLVENVGFDYHARPVAILKGRIIAFILFAAYAFGNNIHPFVPAAAMLIFFIGFPWLIVRASIFNARNTSHRGLRFDFVGELGEAVRIFIGWTLMLIPTLGLAMPYIAFRKNKFLVNGHRFGLSQFDTQARAKDFYKIYAAILIVPLMIGVIAAVSLPAYQQYMKKAKTASHAGAALTLNLTGFAAVRPQSEIVLAANETADEVTEMRIVEPVYSDTAPVPAQAGETALQSPTEETAMKPAQVTVQPPAAPKKEASADKTREKLKNPVMALIFLVVAAVYLFIIFIFAGYLQARIANLLWNSTQLDKLSFRSSLRARDFIWLYFSNFVAILLTFGLATPWAQIRMARYRASRLVILGDVDFDQFVGDRKAEVKATGEEIADMFDLDLSFG